MDLSIEDLSIEQLDRLVVRVKVGEALLEISAPRYGGHLFLLDASGNAPLDLWAAGRPINWDGKEPLAGVVRRAVEAVLMRQSFRLIRGGQKDWLIRRVGRPVPRMTPPE